MNRPRTPCRTVVTGAWCCIFCGFGWVNGKHAVSCPLLMTLYAEMMRGRSHRSVPRVLPISSTVLLFNFKRRLDPLIGALCPLRGRDSYWTGIPSTLYAAASVSNLMLWLQIFDIYGPKWLLTTGTFLYIFGLMMTSISDKYYQFLLAQGICSPLGASLVFYPALSCTATWFYKRRALAFGIVSSGSSLGGVIFPTILSRLLPTIGFGWSLRIAGFLVFILLVRTTVCPAYAGVLLWCFAMFVPINYIILEAQAAGMDPGLTAYLLTILNSASLPGRILPGYLGDKWGRFNVMIMMCVLSAIVILGFWIPGTTVNPGSAAVYISFRLLYGFASGAFVGMVPALLSQISADVTKIGARQGVLFACTSIATLTGSPIAGAILSQNGTYWGLQVFTGVMMVGCVLFFIAARVALTGFYVNIKV
ncbi:hypothetical protein MGYG_05017 [Nannizzia gypsea CBS 118893]|uniref:Major facilitator superfamily (MFS) profile domain-containing protein n=1 Tax=Arthroderma gypseum (strain ATCC MYA-4604 / CBS 118893) TaxID=535722 RepID=E4UY21_ARTGP|nr:hypothetical protein MGYG_05017 [Nannizzia gypsea CBS 118893]EFR02014.1 hypothetical protein MGYG_05017 [Nannizzia gypsea CBS 118893]